MYNLPNDSTLKGSQQLLIGSVLIGVLFNILFYDKIPGISILLFISSFYALFFLVAVKKAVIGFNITSLLLLVILLLSATFALFRNPILLPFNVLAIPILVAAHTILVKGKNSAAWHSVAFIEDLICEGLIGLLSNLFKPFAIIAETIGKLGSKNPASEARKNLIKIIIGLIVSLPIGYVVINLLSSADAVFENSLKNLSTLFIEIKLDSILVQGFLILIMTLFVFSYLWSLLSEKRKSSILPEQQNRERKVFRLDVMIVSTVLAVLCLIYIAFICIQFTYLFSSVSLKLPSGLTYADYARRGFFELIMVTLINLTVLFAAISLSNMQKAKGFRTLRLLDTLLVSCTMILLFSAHFRMSLYERAYGYTYLRFFTHAFMVYLALLLIVIGVWLWYQRFTLSKYLVVLSLLAFTAINYVNADRIIAAQNTAAWKETGKIDSSYLSQLAYDGVPYMLDVLEQLKKEQPGSKEAYLLENTLFMDKRQLNKPIHWQSFNLSASRARALLKDYPLTYRQVDIGYDFMD